VRSFRYCSADAGLWVTLGAAVAYCAWLGWHWLPLGYTSRELAAGASRVWDIRQELTEHGRLPWWTPRYMSGYSYALQYSQGLPLLPWLALSAVANLAVAGKLVALGAMVAGSVAMYFCACRVLRDRRAATLSALAFLLHPQQLARAAEAEQVGLVVALAFIPLVWLCCARAFASGRPRDAAWCALSLGGLVWTSSKQLLVLLPFLLTSLATTMWHARRCRPLAVTARAGAAVAVLSLGLVVFCLIPGVYESQQVKLLYGDPVESWQRLYAFKSLLALVDRDAVVTRTAVEAVTRDVQQRGGIVAEEVDAGRVKRVLALGSDAPGKYTGIVLLGLVGATVLFNCRRADRTAFWFFIAMLLASIACATGPDSVWESNWATLDALLMLSSVPASCRLLVLAGLAASVAFLVLLAWRKLSTFRRWIVAAGVLVPFLFLSPFPIITRLPGFREVRAPFAFYDLPEVFAVAMLAGFFVTDVLFRERWRAQVPKVVAILALLMLLDHWPNQRPTKESDVPDQTLANLESVYRSLRSDESWTKVYGVSTRYFHLLGPMYSNKPMVYEAWTNWMSPLGTALLHQDAYSSLEAHRAFLDLMGAAHVVFDKSDNNVRPAAMQLLAAYRRLFVVEREDEDFVLFRNPTARPYVSAYAKTYLYVGDVRGSPRLALALAARQFPLVHAPAAGAAGLAPDRLRRLEAIYVQPDQLLQGLPEDLQTKVVVMQPNTPLPRPNAAAAPVMLEGVRLAREHAGLIRIALRTPAPCLVVVAESYYPYWRAEIDGRPSEVLRVSTGLMGLELAEGEHTILLHYEPPRIYTAAGFLSLLTLLGCIALVWGRPRLETPERRRDPAIERDPGRGS